MEGKRKPGRPPGSLNKATIAKRAEALAIIDIKKNRPDLILF